MLYYYPIFESSVPVPQIHGNTQLAFGPLLRKMVDSYRPIGGLSAFYNDLSVKGIPAHLQKDFQALASKLNYTITDKPMRHIGRSFTHQDYGIFQVFKENKLIVTPDKDREYLIHHFGSFSIPYDYYEAFEVLGSFITGQDSIFFKWAEFSVNASGQNLSIEKVVGEVLKSPITSRDVLESKKLYQSMLKSEGSVSCVWTGEPIRSYDVDHVIPFSVWKNNDLWNLLPSHPKTNSQKKDKIPSVSLIARQKDLIVHYWEILLAHQPGRFEKEIQVSLLGNHGFRSSNWQNQALEQLQKSCGYLIEKRGLRNGIGFSSKLEVQSSKGWLFGGVRRKFKWAVNSLYSLNSPFGACPDFTSGGWGASKLEVQGSKGRVKG
jgi:hypothetical protein